MKTAIISDIHGNAPAFRSVLEDAKSKGITNYIVAGDYCLSGPYPNECIELLRNLNNSYIIRGNEEQYVENLIGKDQSTWTDGQMQISYWVYKNLSKDNLDYLMNLPEILEYSYKGIDIHIAHSILEFTESKIMDKICSTAIEIEFGEQELSRSIIDNYVIDSIENTPDFDADLSAMEDGIYIFGHSHIQWTYKVKDRNIYFINPGSCGLPLDGMVNTIPYSILEISDEGTVNVEQCRVPFDVDTYVEDVKKTPQYVEAAVWTKVMLREIKHEKEQILFFLKFVEDYANSINDSRRPYAIDTWEKSYELWSAQCKYKLNE